MKIKQFLIILSATLLINVNIFAQLGINSDNSVPSTNAMLDVKSTTKGILIPRVAADLASPTEGLLYYNTDNHNFRYYDGSAWQAALFGNQWNINGANISYSGGNVGIGASTPIAPLNIFSNIKAIAQFQNSNSGTFSTDGFLVGINNSSFTDAIIWNFENTSMKFGTNNIERITILPSGNVGVGDISPEVRLDVNGGVHVQKDLLLKETLFQPATSSNYDPFDRQDRSFITIEPSSSSIVTTINGFSIPTTTQQFGTVLYLSNGANGSIVLKNNAATVQKERILTNTGADVTITSRGGAIFIYDFNGWRLIAYAE